MGNLIRPFKELTLADRMRAIKRAPWLMLDISVSMNGDVEPGHRKIDALRDIVRGLKGVHKCMAFNGSVQTCDIDNVPEPSGGTSFSPWLNMMHDAGATEAIVITDGDVNMHDQEPTLKAVKGISLKVLYVGPGPKPKFLEDLAAASGGFCSQEDLKLTKELETKVQGLLGPAEGGGSIQL